jgi:hypothetical protein
LNLVVVGEVLGGDAERRLLAQQSEPALEEPPGLEVVLPLDVFVKNQGEVGNQLVLFHVPGAPRLGLIAQELGGAVGDLEAAAGRVQARTGGRLVRLKRAGFLARPILVHGDQAKPIQILGRGKWGVTLLLELLGEPPEVFVEGRFRQAN